MHNATLKKKIEKTQRIFAAAKQCPGSVNSNSAEIKKLELRIEQTFRKLGCEPL